MGRNTKSFISSMMIMMGTTLLMIIKQREENCKRLSIITIATTHIAPIWSSRKKKPERIYFPVRNASHNLTLDSLQVEFEEKKYETLEIFIADDQRTKEHCRKKSENIKGGIISTLTRAPMFYSCCFMLAWLFFYKYNVSMLALENSFQFRVSCLRGKIYQVQRPFSLDNSELW